MKILIYYINKSTNPSPELSNRAGPEQVTVLAVGISQDHLKVYPLHSRC